MREARLIMPNTDETIHVELRRCLAHTFYGYTASYGTGGWFEGRDTPIEEPIAIYDIAMDNYARNHNRLRGIAILYGRRLEQKAVYVRFADGETEIITIPAEAPEAPVLGTKRLPQVGEVWLTAAGGSAAVVKTATVMDGGYECILLSPGSLVHQPGYVFTVNLDGRFLRFDYDVDHPLDLVRFHSTFL